MKKKKFTIEEVMTKVQRLMESRNAARPVAGSYQRLREIYVTAHELSTLLESCSAGKGAFNNPAAKELAAEAVTYLAGLHALANETLMELGGTSNEN